VIRSRWPTRISSPYQGLTGRNFPRRCMASPPFRRCVLTSSVHSGPFRSFAFVRSSGADDFRLEVPFFPAPSVKTPPSRRSPCFPASSSVLASQCIVLQQVLLFPQFIFFLPLHFFVSRRLFLGQLPFPLVLSPFKERASRLFFCFYARNLISFESFRSARLSLCLAYPFSSPLKMGGLRLMVSFLVSLCNFISPPFFFFDAVLRRPQTSEVLFPPRSCAVWRGPSSPPDFLPFAESGGVSLRNVLLLFSPSSAFFFCGRARAGSVKAVPAAFPLCAAILPPVRFLRCSFPCKEFSSLSFPVAMVERVLGLF